MSQSFHELTLDLLSRACGMADDDILYKAPEQKIALILSFIDAAYDAGHDPLDAIPRFKAQREAAQTIDKGETT